MPLKEIIALLTILILVAYFSYTFAILNFKNNGQPEFNNSDNKIMGLLVLLLYFAGLLFGYLIIVYISIFLPVKVSLNFFYYYSGIAILVLLIIPVIMFNYFKNKLERRTNSIFYEGASLLISQKKHHFYVKFSLMILFLHAIGISIVFFSIYNNASEIVVNVKQYQHIDKSDTEEYINLDVNLFEKEVKSPDRNGKSNLEKSKSLKTINKIANTSFGYFFLIFSILTILVTSGYVYAYGISFKFVEYKFYYDEKYNEIKGYLISTNKKYKVIKPSDNRTVVYLRRELIKKYEPCVTYKNDIKKLKLFTRFISVILDR